MGKSPSSDENVLKKGPWTPEEDKKLSQYIQMHGHGSWRALPKLAGLNRCGKSCRLRWTNYLRPDIKRGKFSKEEEKTILNLHSILGNKWSAIATHLPGRTDNEIKNFWNTHLKKKLIQMGFDPVTHRPRLNLFTSLPQLIALANLRDVMGHHPWEEHAARLQEAVQLANLQYMQCLFQSTATMTGGANSLNMDSLNLLSAIPSPKEIMLSNSCQLENAARPSLGFVPCPPLTDEIPFNHQSDLQFPCDFQSPMCKEINQDENCRIFNQGDTTPTSPLPPSLPNIFIENSTGNGGGDACSTFSYEGAATPFWNELFIEDPFLHEIAFNVREV